MSVGFARLTAWALWEMAYHDLAIRILGFGKVRNKMAKQRTASRSPAADTTAQICEAVNLAACFYVKPVRCLQKSMVTTRLLRRSGVDAKVVIGVRQAPFFSHAWVEVNARVVNDSPAYKEQLAVLSAM